MRNKTNKQLGLTLFFSAVVFIILFVTVILMFTATLILHRFDFFGPRQPASLLPPIFTLLFFSLVVGTVISLIVGRISLKPFEKAIAAINRLASGDFSVRLDLPRLYGFKELSDSFNRMAEELGGLEMLRSDFVNSFSHEFKTPIVSIKGFAEMLKYDDLTTEERKEYLDTVITESERLASLATNVLNLSKVENQSILSVKERFNLTEQIRRCIILFELKWTRKNIELSVDMDEIDVCANGELLSQAWINLIDNAVKFAGDGGIVRINLRKNANTAHFRIFNSGKSLSDEEAAHVFDKFYQADSSRSTDGNGIGLSVAKKIIALHGGDVTCDNTDPGGTAFVVKLPIDGE